MPSEDLGRMVICLSGPLALPAGGRGGGGSPALWGAVDGMLLLRGGGGTGPLPGGAIEPGVGNCPTPCVGMPGTGPVPDPWAKAPGTSIAPPAGITPVDGSVVKKAVCWRPLDCRPLDGLIGNGGGSMGGPGEGGAGFAAGAGAGRAVPCGGLIGGGAGTVYDRKTHKKVVRE